MIFFQFLGSDEETSSSQNMKIVVQIYTNISIIAWEKNILMRLFILEWPAKITSIPFPNFFSNFSLNRYGVISENSSLDSH